MSYWGAKLYNMSTLKSYIQNRVLLKWGDCRGSVNVRVNPEKLTFFLNKNKGAKFYTGVQNYMICVHKNLAFKVLFCSFGAARGTQ